MSAVRAGLPSTPLPSVRSAGLLSPQLSYAAFLEKCDYNMPQVYWMKAHNPVYDLTKSFEEI
jgi:hypothetical protein